MTTEQPPRAHHHLWQTVRQQRVTVALIAGVAVSVALIVDVAADGPGAEFARWIALVPAFLGALLYFLRIQATSLRQWDSDVPAAASNAASSGTCSASRRRCPSLIDGLP